MYFRKIAVGGNDLCHAGEHHGFFSTFGLIPRHQSLAPAGLPVSLYIQQAGFFQSLHSAHVPFIS